MRWRYAAALLAALLGVGLVSAPASAEGWKALFRVADPRIGESSGLVDLGRYVVTMNDSGNAPDVFVLDPASGRTVGITHLGVKLIDAEALAPAGGSAVWLGDIGDNTQSRPFVSVYRVPVAAGRRLDPVVRPYRLVYPDGRHDAESMFVDGNGRLYVISKGFAGGFVYQAPRTLSGAHLNRLVRIGRVPEFATDAAMLPGGTHLIVRGYGDAGVYQLDGLKRLGGFSLPMQRQGEGISVGPTGRILISSEGVNQVVDQVALPAELAAQVAPSASPSPTPSASESSSPSSSPAPSPEGSVSAQAPTRRTVDDDGGTGVATKALLWSIPAVILLGALGIGLALRRRTP